MAKIKYQLKQPYTLADLKEMKAVYASGNLTVNQLCEIERRMRERYGPKQRPLEGRIEIVREIVNEAD